MPTKATAPSHLLFRKGLGDGDIRTCPSPEVYHLYALHKEADYHMMVRQVGMASNPLNVVIGAKMEQPLCLPAAWKGTQVFLDQRDVIGAIRSNAKDQHYLDIRNRFARKYSFLCVLVVIIIFCFYLLFDLALGWDKILWALPVVAAALWGCLPLGLAAADSVHNEKWIESEECKLLELL